jgi:hypothetical protein
LDDLGANGACRFREIARPVRVHRRGLRRVPFGFIDLQHRAVENQLRTEIADDPTDAGAVSDVESGMGERPHLMPVTEFSR